VNVGRTFYTPLEAMTNTAQFGDSKYTGQPSTNMAIKHTSFTKLSITNYRSQIIVKFVSVKQPHYDESHWH